MLPELDDTLSETMKKEGPLGEHPPRDSVIVYIVRWTRAGRRRPHWGYSDGWLTAWCWLGGARTRLCQCHIVASLVLGELLRCGDHCCEVTAVNIHRDTQVSFQRAQFI